MRLVTTLVLIALLIVAAFSFFCCGNPSIVASGAGEACKVQDISLMRQLSAYRYRNSSASLWDSYTVDFDVVDIDVECSTLSSSLLGTVFRLQNIEELPLKGTMAHTNGIYYIRLRNIVGVYEFLINTNDNLYAHCYSGSLLANWFLNVEFTDGWQVTDDYGKMPGISNVRYSLDFIDKFYDRPMLSLFKDEQSYTCNNGIYTLDKSNTSNILPKLNDYLDFRIHNSYTGTLLGSFTKWEITSYGAVVDISNPAKPKVEYDMRIYYPDVNKSVNYKGKTKYSNIGNTEIEIPSDVQSSWNEYRR